MCYKTLWKNLTIPDLQHKTLPLEELQDYRANVGIIVANLSRQVLWLRRIDHMGWQFPQGGIDDEETPLEAMFRELYEEVGLQEHQVKVLARTQDWLSYRLPKHRQRPGRSKPLIGQKQLWFLLELLCEDDALNLQMAHPEFDRWQWVSYWYPISQIVYFKQAVYRKVLLELAPGLPTPTLQ